ncbi:MAG: hypothetical protein LBQ09_10625 [Acidobacteriaceae bacterium]|jgi:hypothetical protein|nr:hypothetical protein [Acidobacteriaceae bacterium]
MRTRVLLLVLMCDVVLAGCRQPPASRPPARAEQDVVWNTIGTWSGHGNAQLETFPIERLTWRVRWSTSHESPAGSGYLYVTANSGDSGRIMAELIDTEGVGSDVAYITELPHRYYLVVTSANLDWTLTAEEPVLQDAREKAGK